MKQTTTVRFLNMLLALLGFAGITNSCDDNSMLCEYGTPSADYIASGKVVDSKGNPLKDIVIATRAYENEGEVYYSPYDTFHTKADGSFMKKWGSFPGGFTLYLEDADGPENGGEFEPLLFHVKEEDLVKIKDGSGHWNWGTYEAKDLLIQLEEKKLEEEKPE